MVPNCGLCDGSKSYGVLPGFSFLVACVESFWKSVVDFESWKWSGSFVLCGCVSQRYSGRGGSGVDAGVHRKQVTVVNEVNQHLEVHYCSIFFMLLSLSL